MEATRRGLLAFGSFSILGTLKLAIVAIVALGEGSRKDLGTLDASSKSLSI
jgi:hypothetical protein